jgi:hypothetical protein
MVLKPDCASNASFWALTDCPVPVVSHAVISANATVAAATFVSIDRFFIGSFSSVWFIVNYRCIWKLPSYTAGRRSPIAQGCRAHRSKPTELLDFDVIGSGGL